MARVSTILGETKFARVPRLFMPEAHVGLVNLAHVGGAAAPQVKG